MNHVLPSLSLALLLAMPAGAATRTVGTGSFERVRVEGPFEVRIASGRSPAAAVSGDKDALERVQLRVDGTTLVVRAVSGGWGEKPSGDRGGAPVVTLATPNLVAVNLLGAGKVVVTGRMRGTRIDLAVTGSGAVSADAVDAEQLAGTVVGNGTLTLAGKARGARLIANGPGAIDAAALVTDDLFAQLDGLGEIKANARYTAQVGNAGLGRVTVSGKPKCRVRAGGGGPVSCGDP